MSHITYRIKIGARSRSCFLPRGVVSSFLLLVAMACSKDQPTVSSGLTPYTIVEPPGFPKLEIPTYNQAYKERIALGRKLYYDPILSNTGLSCSSCHQQKKGFTSPGGPGLPVLPHVNMGWKRNFMWDGRKQGRLEDVMLFEVNEFFMTDITRLNKHPEYPELFEQAYGVKTIHAEDVANALAQFLRVLISADSKFDRVQRSQAQFTEQESKGYAIFNSEKGSCYHCHTPPLFTDNGLHNIGLDSTYSDPASRGYYTVSLDSGDLGRMRTPTLRNVSLRNRFMHDGRFTSLQQVVEQYNSGVKRSRSLDPTMVKDGNRILLNLSQEELAQLEAFLRTLTDSTFINNPFLSPPQ